LTFIIDGTTVTGTAAGISITGRGTGGYDHNNGLIVDVARLRTLYGGTPEIVIRGTIAGETSGYMRMQGMGLAGAVGAGGAFTINIPGTAAIQPAETWWNTNGLPWVGSDPGMNGNITINSITIGSDHIQDLVPFAVPPGTPARTITLNSANSRESNDGNPANRINGFHWEAWTDARGVGPGSTMIIYGDGSFSSTWANTYNTLFRIGRRFPGQGTRISDIGPMSLRYVATNFNSTRGATYLTVYGWTRERTAGGQTYAQIEWYIVDNWRNWVNAGNNPPGSLAAGYKHHGTLSSNGNVYDIITGWRVNQPSLTGDTTFLQIFSVRRGSQLTGAGNNLSGTIDLSAHFDRWAQIALQTHAGTGTRARWASDALRCCMKFRLPLRALAVVIPALAPAM